MPECQKFDCCGDESYTYEVTRATPNPPPVATYTLELDVDPSGSGTTTGAGSWAQNSFVTITATPAVGYVFSGWTGDYVSSSQSAQIYMDGNKTITANFVLATYQVILTANPDGSATLTGAGPYSYGDTAAIEAIPLGYFQFDNWSGDISSINNPENVTINSGKNITANLSLPQYNLGITTLPDGAGNPFGAGTYSAGQTANISSNPSSGYSFYSWSGDVVSTDDPDTVLMDSDKSVIAKYIPSACTIPYAMVLVLDQTGSIGSGGAAAGITIIDHSNVSAVGVVSFGDSVCNIYPITTDLASVRAYLEDAVNNPSTSPFFCDTGGDTPENGVDALNAALNMLSLYSTSSPKSIYFKTDTISYAHNVAIPASVNTLLNSSMMALTYLEFGTDGAGEGNGNYPDAFPETSKVTWQGFPDCTPP